MGLGDGDDDVEKISANASCVHMRNQASQDQNRTQSLRAFTGDHLSRKISTYPERHWPWLQTNWLSVTLRFILQTWFVSYVGFSTVSLSLYDADFKATVGLQAPVVGWQSRMGTIPRSTLLKIGIWSTSLLAECRKRSHTDCWWAYNSG